VKTHEHPCLPALFHSCFSRFSPQLLLPDDVVFEGHVQGCPTAEQLVVVSVQLLQQAVLPLNEAKLPLLLHAVGFDT
jgi:hypothetical protein